MPPCVQRLSAFAPKRTKCALRVKWRDLLYLGLAEKVGNVPGFRRQAEDALGSSTPHSPSDFFFFFPRLKPKTRILAFKALDSFSAGPI
jgi:hypothetical protein